MTNELTIKLIEIAQLFEKEGITCYYVGGCVRDAIMGLEVEDIDICMVGAVDPSKVTLLLGTLKNRGMVDGLVNHVGQQFPVWIVKIGGNKIDFAMARTEKLVGDRRTDFECTVDNVSIEDDLRRRDLTINAIGKNVLTGEVVDPYDGIYHIKMKLCHPVSEAFKEDSLRVIRGARFCARFNLMPTWTFYEYAWDLKPTDISAERVGMELRKVMEQAKNPSIFFKVLKSCGWIRYFFKELDDLDGIQQAPDYHPEGDAFEHTLLSIDEAKDWFTRVVMMCHDLGKRTTTTFNEQKQRWQAIGHEEASVSLTNSMLNRIKFESKHTIRQIEALVLLHMTRIHTSESTIRRNLRMLLKVGLHYRQLVEVCRCDVSSRPPLPKYTPDIGQKRAAEIMNEDGMCPIVTGEVLIEKGISPGAWMGWLVKKGLELQDRGTLNRENWWKVLSQYEEKNFTTEQGGKNVTEKL